MNMNTLELDEKLILRMAGRTDMQTDAVRAEFDCDDDHDDDD